MRRAVDQLIHRRKYDAVVIQLYPAVQFRPKGFEGPVILDFEDPPSTKEALTARWLGRLARLRTTIDHPRLVSYERACVERFDKVVFASRRDAAEFAQQYGCFDRSRFVPHAVDVDTSDSNRVAGMVVMSGNMGHPPNVAAAEFVCRDVFPRVLRAMPQATLWVVGATPTRAVRALGRAKSVTVTGRVSDVRFYLRQAMVAVCGVPVVIGAQTKILEALACGTPVVTTSAGNHGIEAVSGEHLYVADDAAEFAERIISLLKGERWLDLSRAGRRLVHERFSVDRAGLALESVLREAVAERGGAECSRA